jgi:hypothetical protein
MKFSAKKFMSLVFAAGSAAATLPSLSVLGDRYTADGRRVQLTGFENGTIEMRLLGGRRSMQAGGQRLWTLHTA